MVGFDTLVVVCIVYVAFLFIIAFAAERHAQGGHAGWLRSPVIYTLSLSIYCTAWTFYGAVGYAARSGLEFLTIYLGPTIVFVGWWWFLRKMVRVGRMQRITSVADLISSRYGKSNLLAVIVTLLAVVGTTPYIALQLQSVTLSFDVFAAPAAEAWAPRDRTSTAFWVAVGLALFTVLFGTRSLDANEQHHGVVTAIAVEAVVKLVALLAVGVFVVWGVAGGPGAVLDRIDESAIAQWQGTGGRWVPLIFLSGAAVICLPRMFQVTVVENSDERHLATASWAFPLYLLLMSLFVVPIAVIGLAVQPPDANPDLFVLTLPLAFERETLALLAFLGGFSSATSMVIVAAIALSTMVSNHIVMPLWLRMREGTATVSGDVRNVALTARRLSIGGVLALGYTYYSFTSGSEALAAIGLISFVGVTQALPALVGGLFWRGATRRGAAAGLIAGFALWLYTLFLPSFGGSWLLPATILADGPFSIHWLRPQALFGIGGDDPLIHAMGWSLGVNTALFVVVSLLSFPSPLERLQGAQFVNVFQHSTGPGGWIGGSAAAEDLLIMSQRLLGAPEAQALFQAAAHRQGKEGNLPDPTREFIDLLERELSGSVGAATAHAMVGQITGGVSVSVEDLLAVADETAQIMEYSAQLEAKSKELAETAAQLRTANAMLTQLSVQKDAFLSQISHELRTPMSSIRAFSEILRDTRGLSQEEFQRFSSIIHDESLRLTRLLDDLLDLSVLENGQVTLHPEEGNLADLLDRAVSAVVPEPRDSRLKIRREPVLEDVPLYTDCDRLRQVFINLIGNALKYCDAAEPELRIKVRVNGTRVAVEFKDNGSGIPEGQQSLIFEKFARLSDHSAAGSAGLGLAICREIMRNLGGSISYMPGPGGARFRVSLPRRVAQAA
ncbi:sodium:solute symporter [Maritimibacter sp. 55A14]|uniref:ATP-binding protein n=1 Tax=Maritimibacter sp. 55A14 TaxID=2174844 RepID=UPI000D61E9D1|nr:ATP-binding protein [Maritimibacter sp. 55A14]PWE30627.1 sodium:solute symporter [Maritimibacter sp. 55A14]